jgi:hypothetical protein
MICVPQVIKALLEAEQEDTLVIHMDDRSTDFLKVIYEGYGFPVISQRVTEQELREAIEAHPRIFMLGHGGPGGLFAGAYQIHDGFGDLLRSKRNGLYIWCNADAYARRNKLSGLVSGMFISEVGEARMFGITATQEEVDASNNAFSITVRAALDQGAPPSMVRQCYTHATCQITKFNQERLYVFAEGEPTPALHPTSKALEPNYKHWTPPPAAAPWASLPKEPALDWNWNYGGYDSPGSPADEGEWLDLFELEVRAAGLDVDQLFSDERINAYIEQCYLDGSRPDQCVAGIQASKHLGEGQDDLPKLPLPAEAKSYARRSGLSSMKRQPQDFINMVAAVTGQKDRQHGFKNRDEGGKVAKAIKESALLNWLLESDEAEDFADYDYKDLYTSTQRLIFHVRRTGVVGDGVDYDFEVPNYGRFRMVNKKTIAGARFSFPKEMLGVIKHMKVLAANRDYPPGAVFVTPFGRYSIHEKTVTPIYGD